MGQIHFYIKPFLDSGEYAASFTEVTRDALSGGISALKKKLDNTQYDVGLFRITDMTLKLRNEHGRYSDIDVSESLFSYKRNNSIMRITWEPGAQGLTPGFFTIDDHTEHIPSEEVTVFEGLLNDDATRSDIDDQEISFKVLGYESIFREIAVPFSSLSNGDLVSDILFDILNQTGITDLLTVSAGNINPANDVAFDSVADLENKTVFDALKQILAVSNSVLYIDLNNNVIVKDRAATADTKESFYGQASTLGGENIQDIKGWNTGKRRVLNYITWKDTTLLQLDQDSIDRFGVNPKEISIAGITTTATRESLMDSVRDEFAQPKAEFDLITPLTDTVAKLELLDKVQIDYPAVIYLDQESSQFPYYGSAEYAVDRYPVTLFSLIIDSADRYKILQKRIDFRNENVTLSLRKV